MTRLTTLACLVGVLVVGWYVWPSETRAVRARVTSLIDSVNTRPDETDLQRMARAASLVSALAPDVTMVLGEGRRLEGREMVLGVARQVMQTRRGMRVELIELDVDLGATRATAVADASVRIDDESYQDVRLQLVKPDGTWLVQSAEIVQPLVRPDISR